MSDRTPYMRAGHILINNGQEVGVILEDIYSGDIMYHFQIFDLVTNEMAIPFDPIPKYIIDAIRTETE